MFESGSDLRSALDDGVESALGRRVWKRPTSGWRASRRRTWVLVLVGAVVAAGGVTAGLLAASGNGAPSALATVDGALATSSLQSYSFTLDSTVRVKGKVTNSDVVSGAIDPGRELGTEQLAVIVGRHPRVVPIRFVAGYVYTQVPSGSGFGKPWDKATAFADMNGTAGTYGFISDQPVSPGELSGLLQPGAAAVRLAGAASGPGWSGNRYTFAASLADDQGSVSGSVYMDAQGRVRRAVTVTTQDGITTDRDLTLGDYGAAIQLTAPPADQVESTREPYLGFYF